MVKLVRAGLVSDKCYAASLLLASGLLGMLVQVAAGSGVSQQ